MDDVPSYETVNELPYLDQVICESLRLYPPVATFIIREAEEETEVGPYRIPPNVTVQVPVWQIHHDPEVWPDPFKFDPERFHQSNKKSHHSMSFIPFGKSPRGSRDQPEPEVLSVDCKGIPFSFFSLNISLDLKTNRGV